jgi:hypothetical protein
VRQLEAPCQFENRHIRDFRIGLVTEYFFQKEYILEYSSRRCFLLMSRHKAASLSPKKKGTLHRVNVTDERLCSTEGNVAVINST